MNDIFSKNYSVSVKQCPMQNSNMFIAIYRWIRRYAVLLVLLAIISWKIGSTLLYGMPPVPQLPPSGYVLEQGTVTLQWNRGNIDKPITLQIATTKDFEEPLFDKEVSGITHPYADNLQRGQVYYWRLIQDDVPGPISNFVVSKQHINL
ncbi:MAG: hypothetical protein JXX14_24380 [Deltaproteobacteria bacterium]|nr:hypothetical protein [Deltaproteobacteria bacterium]